MTNLTEKRAQRARLDAEIRDMEARNQDMRSKNVVRAARAQLGWTQPEMAEKCRKSLRTIAKWEAQKAIEDPIVVWAMERLLQVEETEDQAQGVVEA